MKSKPGLPSVYFIAALDLQAVKIGVSFTHELRLRSLQGLCPVELTHLGSTSGDYITESYLHWKFRHAKRHFEWFNATPDLLSFATNLQDHQEELSEWRNPQQDPPFYRYPLRNAFRALGHTAAELAEYAGVPEKTARVWVQTGAGTKTLPIIVAFLRSHGRKAEVDDVFHGCRKLSSVLKAA